MGRIKRSEIYKQELADSIRKTLEKEEAAKAKASAPAEEKKPVEAKKQTEPDKKVETPKPAETQIETESANNAEVPAPVEKAATPEPVIQPAGEKELKHARPAEEKKQAEKVVIPEPQEQLQPVENDETAAPQKEPEEKKTETKKVTLPKKTKTPKLSGWREVKNRIRRLSRRNGLLLILVELILVLLLSVILSQHISINPDDPAGDSDFIDEISCADGQLSVNTVSVSVPTDGVSYSISYGWGKDDKDYPTVPKAAIASYPAESGDLKYDLSLYRESFTSSKKVPEGKTPSNWFSDWKTVDDDNSKQEPKQSGEINGFLISTVGNDPEGAYETTSFYFAVRTKAGISVYVAEGLLYDKSSQKEFNKVMEDVISSVRTKKQAA